MSLKWFTFHCWLRITILSGYKYEKFAQYNKKNYVRICYVNKISPYKNCLINTILLTVGYRFWFYNILADDACFWKKMITVFGRRQSSKDSHSNWWLAKDFGFIILDDDCFWKRTVI